MDAVLFDLDGTLIDTHRLYASAYHHAFTRELEKLPTPEEFAAARPASERIFLLEWFGLELGDRIHRRMLAHYEANVEALLDGFFEGVQEMVDAVHAQGLSTAIVTGKSRRAYEITAAHVDLSMFEVVIVEDDVPRAKPDPEGIRRAHAALGGGEAVYVGDTPMDAEAATAAGLHAAAALWCRPPELRPRLLAKLEPHVWRLNHPSELLARLELVKDTSP